MIHYPNCWESENHPACRLAEIHRLRAEVAKLENGLREPEWLAGLRDRCDSVSGPVLTHGVVLKLHGQGPLHAHANDEPPCR